MYHICVTRPLEIFVNFVFEHIQAAGIYTIDNLFHSFIVLCENEYAYLLISCLHLSFSNVTFRKYVYSLHTMLCISVTL